MTFHISLTSILLLANALMLAIALLVIIRFRREARAQLEFWQSPIAAALMVDREGQSPAASDDPQRFTQSLMRLERQLLLLRQDFMRNAVKESAIEETRKGRPIARTIVQQSTSLPIENAVRMARHGASVDELAERCGLNIGEARLMQKLHGKPRTTH